jgi:Cu(I)/Ag(I) efflux system periplasmic protein CusF
MVQVNLNPALPWHYLPLSGFAESTMELGKMSTSLAAAMTDGDVRKIDQDAGKVTIKHDDIKPLDMPGMPRVLLPKTRACWST